MLPPYKRFKMGLSCMGLLFFIFAAVANPLPKIQTVFLILMENHNWSSIQGNPNCPYINNTLLPQSSYCLQYFNPPGMHPSEPNYLWLEAGTNFGILNDNPPSSNHQSTTNHLGTLLDQAGISWRTYQENINGITCPTVDAYPYAVRHNPFVFFDNVTANSAYCSNHVRPYSELAGDLRNNTFARYNFITPNLTNDMHDTACSSCNAAAQGDAWLARELPGILASAAYSNAGAVFITWDEGIGGDGPIGMIVLSELAKGGGYSNTIHYDHSSTLRTMQTIFGIQPWLGTAAQANDLSDLFVELSLSSSWTPGHSNFQLIISGAVPGRQLVVETSTNLTAWTYVTNVVVATNTFTIVDPTPANKEYLFYRASLQR